MNPENRVNPARGESPGSVSSAAPSVASRPEVSRSSDEQSELDLGVISTGSPSIDRALSPIEGLGDHPVVDHPEVYEQVLAELSAAMTGQDSPVATREAASPNNVDKVDNRSPVHLDDKGALKSP